MALLLSKKAFAKKRGVTPAAISKAEMKERLEPAMEIDPKDGKLKVNVEKADAILEASAHPARKKQNKDQDQPAPEGLRLEKKPDGYNAVKTERERIKLTGETLALEERLGNTLEKRKVMDAVMAAGQKIREHLAARNRRIAAELATMTDTLQIRAALDEDDRQMLTGLSNDFLRRISGDNSASDNAD